MKYENKININKYVGSTGVILNDYQQNLFFISQKMKNLYNVLNEGTFILTLEEDTPKINLKYQHFNVLTSLTVERKTLMLLNKANVVQKQNVKYLTIDNDRKYSWIQQLQYELQTTKRVVLVSEKQPYCGLLGKFNFIFFNIHALDKSGLR